MSSGTSREAALVTITGPGARARRALQTASAHGLGETEELDDGLLLIELAPLAEPSLVALTVASSLGVPDPGVHSVTDVLTRVLRPKHLPFVVRDNCEHLVQACAELVAHLLQSCPRVVLATSREPLRVTGETVYRIPPLHLPADNQMASLRNSEAGQLFVERARAAQG